MGKGINNHRKIAKVEAKEEIDLKHHSIDELYERAEEEYNKVAKAG